MSAPYTSYKTSVALRDAGAPQGDYTDAECYYCSACGKEYLGTPENGWRRLDPIEEWCGCGVHRTHARAFRADEIIEALDASGLMVEVINTQPDEDAGRWAALVDPSIDFLVPLYYGRAASLVEALAAAWLSVLKEEK